MILFVLRFYLFDSIKLMTGHKFYTTITIIYKRFSNKNELNSFDKKSIKLDLLWAINLKKVN